MPQVNTHELEVIHQDIKELIQQTSNLLGKFDAHIRNEAIHQLPPCEYHKGLTRKIWAVGLIAISGLGSALYNALRDAQ